MCRRPPPGAGKERTDMTGFVWMNVGSLILGVTAWLLPLLALNGMALVRQIRQRPRRGADRRG